MFSALIVDDEALARERLQTLLAEEPDFEVVGQCSNGREAVDAIRELQPDLVFLDVEMPELDGFQVIQEIGADAMPMTVFVTAYDQHAVKAFDEHAVDYLLKPFDQARFERTLTRVRRHGGAGQSVVARKLDLLLDQLGAAPEYLEQLVIRSGYRLNVVNTNEVDLITAEGNYLRITAGKQSYVLRDTLSHMGSQLNPKQFVRIHRSTIVRVAHIAHLESVFQGEYMVVLRDGTKLASSRTYRENLERALRIVK